MAPEPLPNAFPTKSVGYFPGYSVPDFSPSKSFGQLQSAGIPGHVSIVTSPFLANSKAPTIPHLLKTDINIKDKKDNASAKKSIVINIINGANTNATLFDVFSQSNQDTHSGLEGILSPMNSMRSGINTLNNQLSRSKRSIAMTESSSKKTESNATIENKNETLLQRSGFTDEEYISYSPPDNKQNIFNLNSFAYYEDDYADNSEYSEYQEEVSNPEPVDPSNLLIGFGGVRSTTRIPFFNKPDNFQNMQQFDEKNDLKNKNGNINEKSNDPLENGVFGDLGNLINLKKNILRPDQKTISTSTKMKQNINPIIRNGKPEPAVQMIVRPVDQTIVKQNNFQLPQRGNNFKDPTPDYSDYTQFEYDEYFNSAGVTVSTSGNKQQGNNNVLNRFPNQPNTNNQYRPYPQNQQYPQYPRNPYAPGYPYPYYPPFSPATSSTSVSCTSGGCAAAASAAAGSSSSSSTSTSTRGGGGSASSSNGYGGASSSSTSGRSSLVQIEADEEFEEWNSFEPIPKEEFLKHLKKDFINNIDIKSRKDNILPVPGIIQPVLERKRRFAQPPQSPSANLISRMTDFMNDDLDNLQEDLELSSDPMVVYMNNRMDIIRESVHNAMDHPEMGDFMRMMLITPLAAILINLFGLPIETTALFGMLVPMFLMQRIGHSENQSHHQ